MNKELINKLVLFYNSKYDKKEKLIIDKVSNENINPIHSNLYKNHSYVHNIRLSAQYAELLLMQKKSYSEKACDILKKVVSLQQNNPLREYYGLWPIYLEESLNKMPTPDLNFAVFISSILLSIYKKFKDILPKDLLHAMKTACCAASVFIVNRNTDFHNSHIVISECYQCVFCGELFSHPEFVNYGMQKLERFSHFVLFNRSFNIFNSPDYASMMASTFGSILENIHNSRVLEITEKLNMLLWRDIAKHYHYTSGQLAGPNSRINSDFLSNNFKYMVSNATNAYILYNIDEVNTHYNNAKCPPQISSFFTGEKYIEYSQLLISHGATYPYFLNSCVATTYICPKFTLGSFNRREFWKENRPLISHFGTTSNPCCAKVHCILDGDDFTSSVLYCIQVKNSVLGHIAFVTDRGKHHVKDEKFQNGIIELSDLRIRYEMITPKSTLILSRNNNSLSVRYNDEIDFNFNFNFYKFANLSPYIELLQSENKTTFDLVLYSGEKTAINISALETAICSFSFNISDTNPTVLHAKDILEDEYLITQTQFQDFKIALKTPVKPTDWVTQSVKNYQEINGIRLEDFAKDSEESALQFEFIINSSSEIPINISDNNSHPIDNIISSIEELTSTDFKNLQTECEKIFVLIRNHNISLDMAKRLSIKILTNIFEIAKNYNLIFENMIRYEYSNIYINISQDNSVTALEKTIYDILNRLNIDYQLFMNKNKEKKFIDSIIDIINNNYQNPSFSLTYISSILGLSEQYISKNFHKQTGITYLKYLTQIRMNHAKELIFSGEIKTDEIARKCGYENISSFLRAFKKHTGYTVRSYFKKSE